MSENKTFQGDNIDRLQPNLNRNIHTIKSTLKSDKYLVVGRVSNVLGDYAIIYMNHMANKDAITRNIVATLRSTDKSNRFLKKTTDDNWVDTLSSYILDSIHIKKSTSMNHIISEILSGNTCILFNNSKQAMIVSTRIVEKRNVGMTETEVTVLGSKEAFNEDLETNMVLIRRRFKTDKLLFKHFVLGHLSNTDVTVCWLRGIASQKIVTDICKKIGKIDVDHIYDVSMINQVIEENPMSIWPQYVLTERPDIVANHLAEGKVAVLCDNSPFALILPVSIFHNVQSPDDYYERPIVGTFFRIIRYFGIFISVYLSPLYLAFTTYNHAIVPPDLAITISDGRTGVPFPSLMELLLMTFIIDMLREAGIRLPRAMGSAIGILGAVVIGQAAVSAGYVSASLVIIISITAIANFTIPSNLLFNAIRIINYAMILAAGMLGIYGIHLLSILLLWQLVRCHSFGVPLLYPVEPGKASALLDVFMRGPLGKFRKNVKR